MDWQNKSENRDDPVQGKDGRYLVLIDRPQFDFRRYSMATLKDGYFTNFEPDFCGAHALVKRYVLITDPEGYEDPDDLY